jgi:hypothetical protein
VLTSSRSLRRNRPLPLTEEQGAAVSGRPTGAGGDPARWAALMADPLDHSGAASKQNGSEAWPTVNTLETWSDDST